jgi:ornithine cyclodeaminase
MAEAVAAMKSAFASFSAGEAQTPLRTRLEVPQEQAVALGMPCFVPASGDLAVKIVNVFPRNPGRGLPTLHALVLAFDPQTGAPLALLEGGTLTALRTGAASGAATDLLARDDAQVLAVFGSGVQARTQVRAVCAVRRIAEVRVYSLDPAGAQAMAEELARTPEVEATLRVAATPEQAANGAHVICTATTSSTPVVPDRAVSSGAHINAIGAYTAEMQEIEPDTVARVRLFVDSRQAALAEAGDLIVPIRQGRIAESAIVAELGEVISGQAPGRTSDDEVTLFKSVGLAVQDAVAAGAILRKAQSLGLGTMIEL